MSCNSTATNSTNNNATVAITSSKPTPHPSGQNALKSLRRMAAATEVGINFQEYGKRVIDLKADIDEDLSQLPEGELKQEIKLAVEAYVDANTAWNEMSDNNYLSTAFEPGKTLQKKYSMRGLPAPDLKVKLPKGMEGYAGSLMVPKNIALNTIWGVARKHIDKATQLQNQ